jgi:hypothetical protein
MNKLKYTESNINLRRLPLLAFGAVVVRKREISVGRPALRFQKSRDGVVDELVKIPTVACHQAPHGFDSIPGVPDPSRFSQNASVLVDSVVDRLDLCHLEPVIFSTLCHLHPFFQVIVTTHSFSLVTLRFCGRSSRKRGG